jgi:hypothetical protein
MSPRVRQQIQHTGGIWLAWTVAGLFYITQDSVPRLYRGEPIPWTYVFVGWMAAITSARHGRQPSSGSGGAGPSSGASGM